MRRALLTATEVAALAVVVTGCALVALPLALIVGGVAVIAAIEAHS